MTTRTPITLVNGSVNIDLVCEAPNCTHADSCIYSHCGPKEPNISLFQPAIRITQYAVTGVDCRSHDEGGPGIQLIGQ